MGSCQPGYLFLNGRMVPYGEAKVHALIPAMKYGASVFEGLRAYWNEGEQQLYIFRLDAHTRRLHQSMKIMRMDIPDSIYHINDDTIAVLGKNQIRQDCHIRQLVFVDGAQRAGLTATGPIGILVAPFPFRRQFPDEGIHCSVSSWRRISDNSMPPRVKCAANYQNARLSLLQAQLDGYDRTILLNEAGKVAEDPAACFFMVRDRVSITPSVTSGILESITRATLIHLFREVQGVEVIQRDIDRTELYVAEEAFICGSGAEITPVISIDRYPVGDGAVGPITRAMRELYFQVVRGEVPLYQEWRTPVYPS